MEHLRYRVGIDVGLNSVGLAAIAVGEDDSPVKVLGAVSYIHDSGVDPLQGKTAKTRLAESGVARRTRRLVQRRRKRLRALDAFLTAQGWPLVDLETERDPWLPWKVRAELAETRITDAAELGRALSIAARHMARHRGWRNPWTSVKSLLATREPSDFLEAFRERVEQLAGPDLPPSATPAQLVMAAKSGPSLKLRGEAGLLGGKLHQSDNVAELRVIAETQGLSDLLFHQLVERVFEAKSPKGSAAKRVAKDPLPKRGHLPRAAKATLAFQRFRIAAVIGNLRIAEGGGEERKLTPAERTRVMEFLDSAREVPSWAEVAELLGVARRALRGTATASADGEPVATRPPINLTNRDMAATKVKAVREWWAKADLEGREALVQALSNAGELGEGSPGELAAAELIESLDEDEMGKLDSLHLAGGRAAYSVESLRELAERILTTEDDLHYARKELFGVDDTWRPPVEAIGEPVGNPAVDRVLKIVARWLYAADAKWGAPASINLEHVREGFMSEATARQEVRDNEARFKRRQAIVEDVRRRLGVEGAVHASDVRRFQAIQRQNCQCLYCGAQIDYWTAEMDHIVPRAGAGSNNKMANLAAVCIACNRSKSNTPFAVWAATNPRPGVSLKDAIGRVNHFLDEDGMRGAARAKFLKDVKDRLSATEADDPIDARDIESVAWMANQLHLRIARHFADRGTEMRVYRGSITAAARLASGLEGKIQLIGSGGKSRLDRRHHAVDAAVVALLRQAVATTLVERGQLRAEQRLTREEQTWKTYKGANPGNVVLYDRWLGQMEELTALLNDALAEDRVPVMENLRLRLGSSAAHDDTIRKLDKRRVGEAIPAKIVNRASSPALWCALTRQPDFSPEDGLPANPGRSLRVKNRVLGPDDTIGFFGTDSAAIEVRGGYAEIGGTIHHARIYRVDTGKKTFYGMVRVFHTDLAAHRSEDLFQVALPPQSISMRTAEPRTRKAIEDGQATYIGWLVEGDELLLDMSSQKKGLVGEFLEEYPGTVRWRVAGFDAPSKPRLRPRQLAAEGLPGDASEGSRKIVDSPGWRPSVDVLFGRCRPTVIRRDALARPRLESGAHLPVSWSA
ncbi:MAG: HNH endonuclease [Bifidobacteriaceae bacterium]|jgi:CRISPR-associated endonuclease Csn1|nr:HNH endonuclease [Bifidobacteriaceae bacterium]